MRWISAHAGFIFAADYFQMEDVGTWHEARGKTYMEVRFKSCVHITKYITGYGMSYLVKGEVGRNIEQ